MALYKPTELHQFLQELGIAPKKGLSQNFLIDGNIVRKIVAKADLSPGDVVLEIGPGPGSITEALLEEGVKVIAVEKDPILAEALKRIPGHENLIVFCEDIQNFPIEKVLREHLPAGKKGVIVGNLPHHLTTPIITSVVPMDSIVQRVVVMVQREVATRFVAPPGNRDYGSITVFLNFYSEPKEAFPVSSNCFYPVPDVQSAIVTFDLHPHPKVSSVERFFQMTRTCFQQRRKMIRKTLSKIYPQETIQRALGNIGCNQQARPEELSAAEWVNLFHQISIGKANPE